jgi:hypothetical protein
MQRRGPMQQRGPILLGAAAVGALFLAGLFIHGVVGGVLLLLTAAILVTLSWGAWSRMQPQGRPLRVVVIVVIAVLAVLKIAHG